MSNRIIATIDLKNYNSESSVYKRTAVRGIIKDGEKYLLITSKYGECKFPGGGRKEGETLEDTLFREVLEETGYRVILNSWKENSCKEYGIALERRKGEYEDIIEMTSYYYFCEVEKKAGLRNLDDYEAEYEYQVVWMTLEEAIDKNKKVSNLDACPWVIRDTKVMEQLLARNEFLTKIFPVLPDDMKALLDGHTFQSDSIGCSGARIFLFDNDLVLKTENKREDNDAEYEMMKWMGERSHDVEGVNVPQVIRYYNNGEKTYLLMTRLQGKMACDAEFIKDSKQMVIRLAKALKALWKIDISTCKRKRDLEYKLANARIRINRNLVDIEDAEPETFGPGGFECPMALYEYLVNHRPEEEPVFIHGDFCLPNVFINEDETYGYLDLGNAGIGDKWNDIALALRSLRHNLSDYGKEEEYPVLKSFFFKELGIDEDLEKIRYYILLDELF